MAGVDPNDATAVRLARLDAKRPLRRLPRLLTNTAALLWRTSPSRFATTTVLQLLLAIGTATQVVVGRDALALVLAAPEQGASLSDVAGPLIVLGVITAAVQVLRSIDTIAQEELRQKVAHAALGQVLDVATTVDLEEFESATFFDRLQRAKIAARDTPWSTVRALIGLAASAFGLIALGSVLVSMEPLLLPFVFVATLPTLTVVARQTKARFRLHLQLAQQSRREDYLVNVLTGRDEAKEIRSFNLAPGLRRLHDEIADERITEQLALSRKSARERLLASAISTAVTCLGIGVLIWLVLHHELETAEAAASGYAMQRIQGWLSGAMGSIGSLYDGAFFLDDYAEFVALGDEVSERKWDNRLAGAFSTVTIDALSFAYPGSEHPALDDVSFELRAGEVVALVGENGSGKTTLAKLLCGLYQPTTGAVSWDGVDIATIDPAEVREHIAVIFQDFARYRLTARQNIGLGRDDRMEDVGAVRKAARAAGAAAFLEALPHAYDTLLAKDLAGGRDLSVGQWQRVAMARAFFRDAPFLVLDEPTAALDPKAEQALFEQIADLERGRTVLLISHRFSSVRNADRILVLDQGRLVEAGDHEELMALGGLYAEMFTLQAAAYLHSPQRESV